MKQYEITMSCSVGSVKDLFIMPAQSFPRTKYRFAFNTKHGDTNVQNASQSRRYYQRRSKQVNKE